MTESFESRIWKTLSKINVNEKTEKKNGLTYLSWAWAWGVLMEHFPQSKYVIETPKIEADGSVMVGVTLTIQDSEHQASRFMWLPVMDFKNKSIINPSSVDVNKAVMRCLTKAISMFGLGFYIYAGEDLPEEEKRANRVDEQEQENKRQALIKSAEESAKKGVKAMGEFWTSLPTSDTLLIGEKEKARIYNQIAKVADNGTATKNL